MVQFVILVWIDGKEVVKIGDSKICPYPCMYMAH